MQERTEHCLDNRQRYPQQDIGGYMRCDIAGRVLQITAKRHDIWEIEQGQGLPAIEPCRDIIQDMQSVVIFEST
jgi:hypothetical protein